MAVLAIAAAFVAAAWLFGYGEPESTGPVVPAPATADVSSESSVPSAPDTAPVSSAVDARETALAELMGLSESYRNNTLLVAIHDAGFVCQVVTSALPVGVPMTGWQVQCPRELGYSIVVNEAGALEIAPAMNSFDGIVTAPVFTTTPDTQ